MHKRWYGTSQLNGLKIADISIQLPFLIFLHLIISEIPYKMFYSVVFQLRTRFTVDDYSHYLFTPRDLTNWVLGLLRYDLTTGSKDNTADTVLDVWVYEARRLFRDRIVGADNRSKFDNMLVSLVRSDWSSDIFEHVDCEDLKNHIIVLSIDY